MRKNTVKFMWKNYEKELKEKLVEKNSGNLEVLINKNTHSRELNESQHLACHFNGSQTMFTKHLIVMN